MAAIKFRHIVQPEILAEIEPSRLLSLLTPYQEYFAAQGMPHIQGERGRIRYNQLAAILANPSEQIPSLLVDALYFINELSNADAVEKLLVVAQNLHPEIEIAPTACSADIILQLWLTVPDLVIKQHAELLINKPRSFEYFRCNSPPEHFTMPEPTAIQKMLDTLNDWSEKNRRGRTCQIIVADHGDKISFLIRHGMPMERKGVIQNDQSKSISFRPEVYDVVFYDRTTSELGIRATSTKSEKRLYRQAIGTHIFGNHNQFPDDQKFTLAPLAKDGTNALVCSDVDGLEQATLTAFQYKLNDSKNGRYLCSAEDVFVTLQETKTSMPSENDLLMASFSLKIAGLRNPRSVTIRLPNHAIYHRDRDSVIIDDWLTKRGYVNVADR
jgi:hypothetical protein